MLIIKASRAERNEVKTDFHLGKPPAPLGDSRSLTPHRGLSGWLSFGEERNVFGILRPSLGGNPFDNLFRSLA